MKRFCSWIILVVLTFLAKVLMNLIVLLTSWVLGKLSSLSTTLFWILIIFYGGSILSFLLFLYGAGAHLVAHTVQSIHPSKTGMRYIVVAVINVLYGAFVIWGYYVGVITGGSILQNIALACGTIFTVIVAIVGKGLANEEKEKELQGKIEEYMRRQ